jgi:hypothetical protein
VVGFTTGSRGEAPGKKENLRQEMMITMMMMMMMMMIRMRMRITIKY